MPADPAPVPDAPEWAVEMAASMLGYEPDEPVGAFIEPYMVHIARLLASVRKGALREAADVCGVVGSGMSGSNAYDWGAEDCATAILALIDQPPAKESRSDDRESAKQGEAV